MIDFIIAIPSYKRSKILFNNTFNLCLKWNIKLSNIHIFVVEDDYEDYKNVLADYLDVKIIIGPLGLHNMRNFITKYFPNDTPILHMDDDISDLVTLNIDYSVDDVKSSKRYKLVPFVPLNSMSEWISFAFEYTKNHSATLFGIYPVKNGFFMKDSPEITTTLKFCVGVFWGIWNDHNILINIEEKEDFERTLLCYDKDKKIIRFNWIAPVTKYYKTQGGMQYHNKDRKHESKISCDYLLNNWSQYCKLYTSKKSGIYEIRFKI